LVLLFQPMFDEFFNPPGDRQSLSTSEVQDPVIPSGPSESITMDVDAPSGSSFISSSDHQSTSVQHGVAAELSSEANLSAATDPVPFVNVFAPDPNFEASSSEVNTITEPN
nr:hypothetical protein [Tanacetum cinerariifolium]